MNKLLLLMLLAVTSEPLLGQPRLFWSNPSDRSIWVSSLDGSAPKALLQDPVAEVRGLAYDASGGKLYWIDRVRRKIQRSNPDGSVVEDVAVAPTGAGLYDLAVDPVGGHVYWTDDLEGSISRIEIGGSNIETILTGISRPRGIVVNPSTTTMYWCEFDSMAIREAKFDGSDRKTLITTSSRPRDLSIDFVRSKVYWVEFNAVLRGNLDGTVDGELINGGIMISVVVDPANSLVYWSDTDSVYSSDLNGLNPQSLTETPSFAWDLEVEPTGKLYWFDGLSGQINLTSPDGSQTNGILDRVVGVSAYSIQQRLTDGKIYWGGQLGIKRSNSDGTDIETIVSRSSLGGGRVESIAIDNDAAVIYWSEISPGSIRRANLDGTGIEDIVTVDVDAPGNIDIDPSAGTLYWSDYLLRHIRRANLDGSNPATILSGGRPEGIDVDVSAQKIYWTDWEAGKIVRSELDGTLAEDLVTGLSGPESIELDAGGMKMYWTDWGTNEVLRANLDGSAVESLYEAASGNPWGITIGTGSVTAIDGRDRTDGSVSSQSYPNPVFTVGTISYTLTRTAEMKLSIFDLLGRRVQELPSATRPPGTYEVTFDATDLASGVYFYRLQAGEYVEMKRMVVVR